MVANILIAAKAAPNVVGWCGRSGLWQRKKFGKNNRLPSLKQSNLKPHPGNRSLRCGRYSERYRPYLITTVTWQRQPFFNDVSVGRIVVEQMRRMQEDGLVQSMAWVLMPNHLHWMVQLMEHVDLARVMFFVKGRSAHYINKKLNRKGPVWQKAFYDHALRKDENVEKMARYIIENPLRKGLAEKIGDYPLWDAVWV